MEVKGPWIETYTHKQFPIEHPDSDKVFIEDIAHHLSQQCQFVGASRQFYSIAEHAIIMSRLCTKPARLSCLLHDAHKAYLGDPGRPLKLIIAKHSEYNNYGALADRIDLAIQKGLGFKFRRLTEVKYWDLAMLRIEALEVLGSPLISKWKIPPIPEIYKIEPSVFRSLTISFREVKDYVEHAERRFLELYERYEAEEWRYKV